MIVSGINESVVSGIEDMVVSCDIVVDGSSVVFSTEGRSPRSGSLVEVDEEDEKVLVDDAPKPGGKRVPPVAGVLAVLEDVDVEVLVVEDVLEELDVDEDVDVDVS